MSLPNPLPERDLKVDVSASSVSGSSGKVNESRPEEASLAMSVLSQTSTQSEAQSQVTEVDENLEDYETQLFGFTPKSFISGMYNAVSEYFMEALKTMEDYIADHYGELMTQNEVVEKMTIIRRHLVTQIDKAFDTLETYLGKNVFCIPPNVVLPEDRVQVEASVTQQEAEQVLQEIEMVKKKILAVKLANAILKKRLQQTMDVQRTLDTILDHLNQADSAVRKEGVVDLRDSLKHCSDRVLGTISILKNLQDGEAVCTTELHDCMK